MAFTQCKKFIESVASSTDMESLLMSPKSSPLVFSPQMTSSDYERFCALLLRKAGWDAHVTQASNDQGCDVIAVKSGRKLVVQCKLYSSSVGNSAVQEISASRLHEQADFAAVVSNAAFTKPALRLANTNHVMLMHHDQLSDVDRKITALTVQTNPTL